MPKVSIVLPTYNGEKFIRESIESVINQTFTDWELIIVDDCSNDNTPAIIDKYAEQDLRIKVIHNSVNQKLPKSLNIGFEVSTGDFLTWTSDDNIYMPKAIYKMFDYLSQNKNEYMVCASMEYIDDNNLLINKKFLDYKKENIFLFNPIGACFMYKKKVLETIGEYDSDLFCVEDYDYWIRIYSKYDSIGYISEILYRYRIHGNSLTSVQTLKIQKQIAKIRNKYSEFISNGLKNNKSYLWQIYIEFIEADYTYNDISKELLKNIREAKNDRVPKKEKKIIAFGTGFFGDELYKLIGHKIAYYVDNNSQIIGHSKNDIRIISFSKLKEIYSNEFSVIISVSKEKSYSIVQQLMDSGIYDFCTYQLFKKNIK